MGKAMPRATKELIVKRIKQGNNPIDIAEQIGYQLQTVKKFMKRYTEQGPSALDNNYKNCGRKSPYDAEVRREVNRIRDNKQGAYYVYSKLVEKTGEQIGQVPSPRTLNRWWQKQGTSRSKGRPMNEEKK